MYCIAYCFYFTGCTCTVYSCTQYTTVEDYVWLASGLACHHCLIIIIKIGGGGGKSIYFAYLQKNLGGGARAPPPVPYSSSAHDFNY